MTEKFKFERLLMKGFYSVIIILFASAMFNPAPAQDTIYWTPGHKLKWSDFVGLVDPTAPNFAMTSSGIKYKYSLTDTLLTFSVIAFFDKKHSWKMAYATSHMLSHEQLHFDITEIFARKLKTELAKLKLNAVTGKKTVLDLVEKIVNEYDEMQLQYDCETDHGRNVILQTKWQDIIYDILWEGFGGL